MYLDKEPIDFEADVIEASRSRPVVVDFWAEWCAPCRILSPELEKLANDAGDAWTLVKVNTELQPDLAVQFQIRGIPAVKMIISGNIVGEFVGALPETQIRQWLEHNLPSATRDAVQVAEAALEKGDTYTAMLKVRQVLESEDADADVRKRATVILAEASLTTDPEQSRNLARRFEVGDPFYDRARAVLDRYELEHGNLPENGNSKAARLYVEGVRTWREGDPESALDKLIQSVQEDRSFLDDAARKAIIAIFGILGEDHEITRKYRPRFASAIF
ncbi:MAG: tetratricopeptide repeat protein [Fidelibacterota bacterium]